MLREIRWVRILIAGIVAELALFLFIPLNFLPNGQAILEIIVIPVVVIATFLGGWWAARKANRLHWLHGLLVGALAALLYAGLAATQDQALPLIYVLANWLKLASGAAGGWFAARRMAARRA